GRRARPRGRPSRGVGQQCRQRAASRASSSRWGSAHSSCPHETVAELPKRVGRLACIRRLRSARGIKNRWTLRKRAACRPRVQLAACTPAEPPLRLTTSAKLPRSPATPGPMAVACDLTLGGALKAAGVHETPEAYDATLHVGACHPVL